MASILKLKSLSPARRGNLHGIVVGMNLVRPDRDATVVPRGSSRPPMENQESEVIASGWAGSG